MKYSLVVKDYRGLVNGFLKSVKQGDIIMTQEFDETTKIYKSYGAALKAKTKNFYLRNAEIIAI